MKTQFTYQKKQSFLAFAIIISLILGETVFMVMFSSLTTNLALGKLTKIQYKAQSALYQQYLLGYMAIVGVLIIFSMVFMDLSHKDYEKAQVKVDSQEGPIHLDDFTRFKYLMQSPPDSLKRIKSTKDMLDLLNSSAVYKSLVKSIETGVEGFSFDQANFFKTAYLKLEKEIQNLPPTTAPTQTPDPNQSTTPATTPTAPAPKPPQTVQDLAATLEDTELSIEQRSIQSSPYKKVFESVFSQIFSAEQYQSLASGELCLYYREISSIKRIDDPAIDPDDMDDKKNDRLGNLKAMFYLLPKEEKDFLQYRSRLSPKEEGLELRKAYIDYYFKGMIIQDHALFVDSSLIETNSRVTDKSLADSRVKALAFVTHLAVERDQELRDEINDLRTDNVDLKRSLDKKRDEEFLRMIHNGELENTWRRGFSFEKPNATTLIMLILGILLGIFIQMTFLSSPTTTTNNVSTFRSSNSTKGSILYTLLEFVWVIIKLW